MQLQAYGNAHRAHKPNPAVTYAPMEPVMAALDSEWSVQLDEVSSMIVVSEALAEFPQHIVKKAIELSSEKRTTLVDFVSSQAFVWCLWSVTFSSGIPGGQAFYFMTRIRYCAMCQLTLNKKCSVKAILTMSVSSAFYIDGAYFLLVKRCL